MQPYYRKSAWKHPENKRDEIHNARLIQKAQARGKAQSLLRVWAVTVDYIDYELLSEAWRGGVTQDANDEGRADSVYATLRDPASGAAEDIAQQLLELRRDCGLVYFDLHAWNMGRDAQGRWKLFDFDCR